MSLRALTVIGRSALIGSLVVGLGGCSWLGFGGEPEAPKTAILRQNNDGSAGMNAAARPAGTVTVNAYLWRAALDTVTFMPLVQADPYGGVILTDWYSPPATPNERFKVNLFILDAALRADGVRATLFRQELKNGVWIDAPITAETGTQMEDTILTRARQLRQQSTANSN